MKNIYLDILLILFAFTSCSSPRSINGEYKFRNKPRVEILRLDSNNNFTYDMHLEAINLHSAGKWWRIKDTLFINSFENVTSENGSVIEEINGFFNFTLLQVTDQTGDELQNISVRVNNAETFHTDLDGKLKIVTPITSLFFQFYDRCQFYYTKKNNLSDKLIVSLKGIDLSSRHFDLVKYKIKGKSVIDNKGNRFLKIITP